MLLIAGAVPTLSVELPESFLSYQIEVHLEPKTRALKGKETIRWTNPSSSPINRVPMHLYLNAFSHGDTTWIRATLEQGRRFADLDHINRLHPSPWGWSEPRSIRQADIELKWNAIAPDDGNLLDRSLIEVHLDQPVMPGETLELEVAFDAVLPVPIARTGGFDDFFFVAHWFPKISVFETAGTRGALKDGWNSHQFHGKTEFYADYADFDVRINVPSGWVVGATGTGGPEQVKGDNPENGESWHHYTQRAVHDFAFMTSSNMVDIVSSHRPKGTDHPVSIHVLVPKGTEHQAKRWNKAIVGSLDVLSSRVGPYPYNSVTLVMSPWKAKATVGMEYPTIFTGVMGDPIWDSDPVSAMLFAESVIAHEFVHGYFYGIVGSNEFEEAFLDEGFTEFWGSEAMIGTYGNDHGSGELFSRPITTTSLERWKISKQSDHPMPVWTKPSYLARDYSGGLQFYTRPATILRTLSLLYGQDTLDKIFALYYKRWSFRHPSFEDFLDTARDAAGEEIANFLLEAYTELESPDFRVAKFTTTKWEPPHGRLVTKDGVIEVKPDREIEKHVSLVGLDPSAFEKDGLLMMEILDPGWTRKDKQHPGRIERRRVLPIVGSPDDDWTHKENEFHLSEVRLEGPGWQHLPVDVYFRFSDEATIHETWDGKSRYRIYRFLRKAALSEVRIDPDGLIAFDSNPINNSRLRQPDKEMVSDWSVWLTAVFQLMAEGAMQCL